MIKYTLARTGVFLATWAALWGLSRLVFEGGGEVVFAGVLLVAVIVSSVISLFLLKGMRNQVAASLQQRAAAINERIEESKRAEDVD